MSNYTVTTNFETKDSLPSGNPSKIIKGAEFTVEFNNIATAIASKADINSPAFTGTPTAPTAAVDTNTAQIATTAFVIGQAYLKSATAAATYAPINSPAFTGTPTAPTAAVDTNTTQIATTAFVIGQAYLKSATAAATYAPINSPAFTGTPTAPTAAVDTNTTQIATTAFVIGQAYLKSATAAATYAPLVSPTFTGTVTGEVATFSSQVTGARFNVAGSTTPSNGIYLPAANTLGFASNSVQRGYVNSTGNWTLNSPSSGTTLFVQGGSDLTSVGWSRAIFLNSANVVEFDSGVAGAGRYAFIGATGDGQLYFGRTQLNDGTTSPTYAMSITTGGDVEIRGTTFTSQGLRVGGRAHTEPRSVSFSSTPTFDAALSNVFYFGSLTANVTSMATSNATDGQTIQIRFVQDATGGRTVAVPSGAQISGSINTAANAVTWLVMTYVSSASRWEGTWTRVS